MDLLSIIRKIWRYRLVTLPIVLLTMLGVAYVIAVRQPTYEASSSYILINPPAPPTAEEITRRPALGRINSNNPYTGFGDQTVVVEVLASTLTSTSARAALMKQGADGRYKVGRTDEFGSTSPIVDVTGVGSTARAAIHTAEVVGRAVQRQLRRMQQAEGVHPSYRITTHQIHAPDKAQLHASALARPVLGILALGTFLMVVAVSVADAFSTLRRERRFRAADEWESAQRARNVSEDWWVGDARQLQLAEPGQRSVQTNGATTPAPSAGDGSYDLGPKP